jgi:hypothetical protein
LRIHQFQRRALKNLKNESGKYENLITKILVLLKFLSSKYSFLIVTPIWSLIFSGVMTIIYGIHEFQCTKNTIFFMRIGHFGCLLVLGSIIVLLIIVDIILNLPNIFTCKCKKIFFDDDPHNVRLDILSSLAMIPITIVWGIVPMPQTFNGILVEIILFTYFMVLGGMDLIITIFKYFYYKCRNQTASSDNKLCLEDIFSNNELTEIFGKYCESEWSSENFQFREDVKVYLNTPPKERKKHCQSMKAKYLDFSSSPFEINAPEREITEVLKKIELSLFEDNLFEKLSKIINNNLSDTLSRYAFSSLYLKHLIEVQSREKSLGL